MTADNRADLDSYRRALQLAVLRAADEFRRLAEALDVAANDVDSLDRAARLHPSVDLVRAVIMRIQAAGSQVDYDTLLRAAADLDTYLVGGQPGPPPEMASGAMRTPSLRMSRREQAPETQRSQRMSRRGAAAEPPAAPVLPSAAMPNTLWVDDDPQRTRYVWIGAVDAAANRTDCWAWYDDTNVRLRRTDIPAVQFQLSGSKYRRADEQQIRRAAQIIAALRGAGVDVSMMKALLGYAPKP
jgi:hypothetical protein